MYNMIVDFIKKFLEENKFMKVEIKKDEHIKFEDKFYVDLDGYYVTSLKTDKKIYKLIVVIFILLSIFFGFMYLKEWKANTEYKSLLTEQWYQISALKTIHEMNDIEIELNEEGKELNFGTFKSYMDYRAITNKTSLQYKLQERAHTDYQGLRRLDSYYMIANGSYYGEIGAIYRITLSDGIAFEAVKSDAKSDIHTDDENKISLSDGSVIEFIVDMEQLEIDAIHSGDISSIGFSGHIVSIERIGFYEVE